MTERPDLTIDRPNRVDWLSVLRLFAWFLVFETHVLVMSGGRVLEPSYAHRGLVWPLLTPAWAGVWIFFTLSGYLMGKAYLGGRYDLTAKGIKAFYFNRLVRIVPLYLFVLALAVLFLNPEVLQPANWHVMVPVLTFTYNGWQPINVIGALWYVSTLMQLYLLTPLFFFFFVRGRFASRRFALGALAVLVVAGVLIRLVPLLLWHEPNPAANWYEWVYSPVWSNLDLYFGGFLLASLNAGRARIRSRVPGAAVVSAIAVLTVATSYVYDKGMNLGVVPLAFIFVYVLPSLWFAVIAAFVMTFDRGPRSEPLSRSAVARNPLRALEAAALLTFGLYIWHEPVLRVISSLFPTGNRWIAFALTWVLGLAVSLVLATVTHFAIERPAARLKL